MMRGAFCFLLLTVALLCVIDATPNGRKAQLRYVNSMPQFGKAKLTAVAPSTVVFDQVPQGYLTDYTQIDAQVWNFTTKFSTNATANSDSTDLDGDSYATVYTCQTDERKLKNELIYDSSRSTSPKKAILRVVNLVQYDYSVSVYNDSSLIFTDVSYCTATNYKEVAPGDYEFSWVVSDLSKRAILQGNNNQSNGGGPVKGGKAYTLFITPMGTTLILDGKKKTRSVRSEVASVISQAAAPAAADAAAAHTVEKVTDSNLLIEKKNENVKRNEAAALSRGGKKNMNGGAKLSSR